MVRELLNLIRALNRRVDVVEQQLKFGLVTGVSPTSVRFPGDTGTSVIALSMDSYSPTTNDRVVLARVGSQWIILGDYS